MGCVMTDLLLQHFKAPCRGELVKALFDEKRKMFGEPKPDAKTRIGIRLRTIRWACHFGKILKGGTQGGSVRRLRIENNKRNS